MLKGLLASAKRPTAAFHVLAALGGSGKTTVALELCKRAESRGFRAWWIVASDSREIVTDMLEVAAELGAPESALDDAREGRGIPSDLVWSYLQASRKWVLVIDNADAPELLGRDQRPVAEGTGWVRPSISGLTVVTSRRTDEEVWGASSRIHALNVLNDVDGAQVLLDLAPTAGSVIEAQALSARLGGMPLALHLAGRHISDPLTGVHTFAAYSRELERRFSALLAEPGSRPHEADRRRTVTTTWDISLDDLNARGYLQVNDVFQVISCFAPATPIPLELLTENIISDQVQLADGTTRRESLEESIRGLRSVGLIDLGSLLAVGEEGLRTLLIHPLVAETTLRKMSVAEFQAVLARAAQSTAVLIGRLRPQEPDTWPLWRAMAPHLGTLLDQTAENKTRATLIDSVNQAAWALCESGDYSIAEDLLRRAIVMGDELGSLHPNVLAAHHCLGGVLREMQRPEDAVIEYREALAGRESVYGLDHVETLATRGNLAGSLWDLGRLEEAEQEYRAVLTARLHVLGASHEATMVAHHNLAGILRSRGQLDDAAREFNIALRAEVDNLGDDHPVTLSTRYSIARVLAEKRESQAAEHAYREVLADRARVLGALHPATFQTRESLAELLAATGRMEEALTEYSTLLSGRTSVLGSLHSETRRTRQAIRDLTGRRYLFQRLRRR
ncbi:tetratricopeptide repeat protein [Streptomyces sp. NBC_00035]|uniref:tetratricopeptide repeat protein n=1 Tax=Streptomyces sp. NBC_00035 TaxID=2903614 RepID=UPI0032506C25